MKPYARCERCGDTAEARQVGPLLRLPEGWEEVRGHAVCPRCMDAVESFIVDSQDSERWGGVRAAEPGANGR